MGVQTRNCFIQGEDITVIFLKYWKLIINMGGDRTQNEN